MPKHEEGAKPCPNCGHCPTCGHSPRMAPVPYPVPYPYPVYPRPIWYQHTPYITVTSGGGPNQCGSMSARGGTYSINASN